MSTLSKRFSRRDFINVLGKSAITLPLLSACAEDATETAAPDTGGGETTTVAGQRGGIWLAPEPPEIKTFVSALSNPNFYTVMPWHLMNDMGYIQEEGFDEMEFLVTNEAFQGIVAKEITFGSIDAGEMISAYNAGVPIVWIGTGRDHELHMYGLRPGAEDWDDIRGEDALVGTPGSRSFASRRQEILKLSGGTFDTAVDCNPIAISGGGDAIAQALMASQVGVSSLVIRHLKGAMDAGCKIIVYGFLEIQQEGLCCHQDTVKESPRAVVNFLRAYLKAINTWRDYTMKEELKRIGKEVHDLELSVDHDNAWVSQVEMIAAEASHRQNTLRIFLDELAAYGVIPENTMQEDFADYSFLQQAQKELLGMAWPPIKQLDNWSILGVDTFQGEVVE